MNGIETYAEQVAIAAQAAGHDTTLLVTNADVAAAVRARHAAYELSVVDLGLRPLSRRRRLMERLVPSHQVRRVGGALRAAVRSGLGDYDVLHLNRPGLAPHARGAATRTYCAGWFYPHTPVRRVIETWRHNRGPTLRRLVLVSKAPSFYLMDERGYRNVDGIVVCTTALAAQLRDRGRGAFVCPPPINLLADHDCPSEEPRRDMAKLRLLVCSADLSHPRKNVADAVRAAGVLSRSGYAVELRVVGGNPESLARAARSLPPSARLELLGPRSAAEVRGEMRRANVLLVPSLFEEWGYVAVESIVSGTPVATFPVYPFDEMLTGGLGVVARSMSPESLAAAAEQAAMGLRGRPLAVAGACRFGSAAVGERLTAIWRGAAAPLPTPLEIDDRVTRYSPEREPIGVHAAGPAPDGSA